jgi:hypothetical protein
MTTSNGLVSSSDQCWIPFVSVSENSHFYLAYWVVFGSFQVLENMVTVVSWFPYYYVFKTAFIIYLILPTTRYVISSLTYEL